MPCPRDGCLYHYSDVGENSYFLSFMHLKAPMSSSSVEKGFPGFLIKRAKKIQNGQNFIAGETEEREDSLGFTCVNRIPFVGLYLNSRASHYVSASSFYYFFFGGGIGFALSEGPGKPYFFPLSFQSGTQFKLHICLWLTYLLWNCSLQRPQPRIFFAPLIETIEHSGCQTQW